MGMVYLISRWQEDVLMLLVGAKGTNRSRIVSETHARGVGDVSKSVNCAG